MIPSVDDTASDMFSFGSRLLDTGSFADVDGQVGFCFAHVNVATGAAGAGKSGIRHVVIVDSCFSSAKAVIESRGFG